MAPQGHEKFSTFGSHTHWEADRLGHFLSLRNTLALSFNGFEDYGEQNYQKSQILTTQLSFEASSPQNPHEFHMNPMQFAGESR